MPNERTAQVAELFKSAIERDEAEWDSFLELECNGDAALRGEVESLLKHHQRGLEFLERTAVHDAADSLLRESTYRPGQIIGHYEIISLVGSGGMGQVYLAEDQDLHRKVALKLIRAGLDSEDLVRHFKREENLLASLNHPNIAQLYASGVSADGVPFFVMEYVEGRRLDEFCNERDLTTRDRLKLFQKVCAAVTYAHQHLVIHRDLKPANIRVTTEGEPKLLDFGIAKLLDAENTQGSGLTLTLQGMMTPEYASPEQINGADITTASDVYSLGVLLYKLLTGQGPYRTKTNRPDEVARAITEQEPERPSTRSNQKSLRGDLDNIVLMAMRKEPTRRYESAAQLSADIRRHLGGLTVIARKDTFQYRATKFVKRHKVSVLAAALVLVTLLGGIAMTTRQKRKAERRFNDVRELADSFVFEMNSAIEQLPGSTPARVLLVNRALKYLTSLAEEAGGDHSLQLELARAYLRVGDIQGSPYRPNIGDTAGALVTYRKGLAILDNLSRSEARNADVQYYLGLANESIGRVQMRQAAWADALASERKALSACEQLVATEPSSAKYRKLMGDTYMQLGMAMQQDDSVLSVENLQQACGMFRRAISIHETLTAAYPLDGENQHALGADYGSLGYAQRKVGDITGDPENYHLAVESHLKELEVNEALFKSDSGNPSYRDLFGVAHMDVANSQMKLGDALHALEHFRVYLSTNEWIAAADPTNVEFQRKVPDAYRLIGLALAQIGDIDGALENSRKALDGLLKEIAADPTNAEIRGELVELYQQIGVILEKAGTPDGALGSYRKALALLEAEQATKKWSAADAARLDEVTKDIARCETAPAN